MSNFQQKILKGYKFRIYPTKEQKVLLEEYFSVCRFVWNFMLGVRQDAYTYGDVSLNYYDTANGLTELKKLEGMNWLKRANSQSLQAECRNLEVAYSNFFRKIGKFPKFKSKKDKQSFKIPQNFELANGKLWIPKLKTPIQVNQHREFGEGFEIKSVTISKNKAGNFYASFLIEEDNLKRKFKSHNQIGIDLGLKDLMVLSDGTKVKNPSIAKGFRGKLEYLHRQLSKKVKGSKNFEKTRLKLAKLHETISNIKLDFTHKLTSKLINENQVICMESLSVANMMKNSKLARSIQEVSWGEIERQLKYKSEWYGRSFIQIDRFFPSSKMCSNDSYINESLKLSDRSWTCPKCGQTHDRDVNAAKNILFQGLTLLKQQNNLSVSGIDSDVKQKRREPLGRILKKFKKDTKVMNFETKQ